MGELLAAVRGVLKAMDSARASMVEAVLRADEAAGIAANATAGTSRPEVRAIAAEYRQGAETVRAAGQVLDRIAEDLAAYVASLGGGGPVPTPGATEAATVPARDEEHAEDPRVVAARERLPPPVTRGRGQKTRGEWFSSDGRSNGTVVSGQDDHTGRVDEMLREANIPRSPLQARLSGRAGTVVTIRAWYEVGQREPTMIDPVRIASFLDEVEAEAREADVPVAANVEIETSGQPLVLQFGVRPEAGLGFASIITARGSFIGTNGTDAVNEVMYDYTGSEVPIEARDEIDLAEVRRAVTEFVTNNGKRCEGITWRELV